MSRQVLECGAIVCSAIALYGWVPPSVSEPSLHDCEMPPDSLNSQGSAAGRSNAVNRCSPTHRSRASFVPNQISNTQWGEYESDRLPDQVESRYSNLLQQAKLEAGQNKFAKAIVGLSGIPKNSRHYTLAQDLQEQWSREVLTQARSECQQARISQAISMLESIPRNSPWRGRVIELRSRWGKQAVSLGAAVAAQKSQNWQEVVDAIKALEGTPMYHSASVQNMLQQAMTNLYEPDQEMLQIAKSDLPMERISVGRSKVLAAI